MSFKSNIPNFDGFGIIANSIGPIPEAFLIKEVANQNTITNPFIDDEFKSTLHNNNYYDPNDSLWEDEDYNSSLWDEDDEDYEEEEY